MQWFRWYHGTAVDMKFGRIARNTKQARERVVFVWAMLLESASDHDTRGTFDVEPADIADVLNCDDGDIAAIIEAMRDAGMIDGNSLVSWEKRQPSRDDSASRMRAKRKRDAPVTRSERNGDAPVTHKETETETETDTEKKGKARGARFTLESLPAEWDEWARSEGFGAPGSEFDRFADYWRAQPGQKGVKTDWFATWRNWIRRALEDGRGREVEAPSKSRQPRPVVTLSWSGGDLPALRNRLRSATGSAWSVYLDRLVPSEPGETSGPAPPDSAMREVWRWAEHYGVTVEQIREAA